MNTTTSTQLNKRALTFFFMIFSAIILPFSGVPLHEALNHNTEVLKFFSMGLHNVAAIVFCVSAIIHINLNWKAILNYLKSKKDELVRYPREMAIAGLTIIVLLLIVISHIVSTHI
ncbi:MAG: DUF4405 domain-containing protein [Anaerolineales bacterium]|nr:DUF4405 domain-containing protein [Anaerolineales bacterium]